MQTIPDQIAQARVAFAEAPDERARMGRISGVLWMFSAMVGMVDVFVPGSDHASTPIVLAVGAADLRSTASAASPAGSPGKRRR